LLHEFNGKKIAEISCRYIASSSSLAGSNGGKLGLICERTQSNENQGGYLTYS
jgi:hypothetical protein